MGLDKGVVDGNDLDVGEFGGDTEDNTTDTAESVDADFDGSHDVCVEEVYLRRRG